MPKHKLECIAQAPPIPSAASSNHFEHNTMQHDQAPPTKRRRVPHLNFSIESMMQPEQQQRIFGANIKQQQQQHQAGVLSRSPSPGLSEAGSASSGSTGTLTERGESQTRFARQLISNQNNNNNNNNNLNHLKNDTESLTSSQGSSRASSPISPGWNHQPESPACSERTNQQQHHFGHLNPNMKGLSGHNHMQQQQQAGSSSSTSFRLTTNQQQQQQPRANLSKATTVASSCAPNSSLNQVDCVLDNKDMWDKFHSLNTEMIITKTGRRMFPVLKVQFLNLDPNARYAVSMSIVPVDNKRYRYAYHKSCWQVAGKADPSAEPRIYPHPDSPFNGDLLSRQVISFEKVKLTNNEMDKSGHIILNSMHKYQPQVHLIKLKSHPMGLQASAQHAPLAAGGKLPSTRQLQQQQQQQQQYQQQQQQPQLEMEDYRTFVFSETVFTAVTAYQNQLITKMKIDKNPFAKGFRDSSRLSDLDRNDPFDYMGALGPAAAAAAAAAACAAGRGFGPPPGAPGSGGPNMPGAAAGQPFPPGFLEAAGLPPISAPHQHHPHNQGQMDQAYAQLLAASAAATQSPWYPAGPGAPSPFGAAASMGAAAAANACSTAQAAQHLQTQLWLAAFTACLNNGTGQQPNPPTPLIGHTPTPPTTTTATTTGSGLHQHHHSNISSPTAELTTPATTTNQERRGDSRSSG